MITTHIFGSLGNQLFQYCYGRALSVRHNVKLRLLWDGREQENTTTRRFDLRHFDIRLRLLCQQSLCADWGFARPKVSCNTGLRGSFGNLHSAMIHVSHPWALMCGSRAIGKAKNFSRRSKIRSAKPPNPHAAIGAEPSPFGTNHIAQCSLAACSAR